MTLKDFLTTGQIKPLRCGMSIDEVLKELGEPTNRLVLDKAHGSFREVRFFYDALTLYFQDDVISMYGFWVEDFDRLPAFLEVTGYFPLGDNVPMDELLGYMRAEGIPFRERTKDEFSSCPYFTHGDVAIQGNTCVHALLKPCPGTERWKTLKERWHFRLSSSQKQ